MGEEMMTSTQASWLLGVNKNAAIQLADAGRLECVRVGKFRLISRRSVEAYLASRIAGLTGQLERRLERNNQ